jgi:hypothetical protein
MDREDTRWRTSIESKQREKYETNQINQNIGGKLALRGIAGLALAQTTTTQRAQTRNGYDHNPADDHQLAGNIVTYTPDSDYFMFRTTSASAPVRYYYTKDTTVVDPRSCRKFVGDPPGHAGHRLLLNSGRPGCGAQSSIGPAPACRCD